MNEWMNERVRRNFALITQWIFINQIILRRLYYVLQLLLVFFVYYTCQLMTTNQRNIYIPRCLSDHFKRTHTHRMVNVNAILFSIYTSRAFGKFICCKNVLATGQNYYEWFNKYTHISTKTQWLERIYVKKIRTDTTDTTTVTTTSNSNIINSRATAQQIISIVLWSYDSQRTENDSRRRVWHTKQQQHQHKELTYKFCVRDEVYITV